MKNNKLLFKVIQIVLTIIASVFAVGAAWNSLCVVKTDVVELKTTTKDLATKYASHDTAIGKIEIKLDYIQKGIDDLKRAQGLPIGRHNPDPNYR